MTSSPVCWKQIMKMFYSRKIDDSAVLAYFTEIYNLWSISLYMWKWRTTWRRNRRTKSNSVVFWVMTPCHLESAYQSFRGNCCLCLHLPSALEIGSAGSSKTLVSTCKTENKNVHCCGNLQSQKNKKKYWDSPGCNWFHYYTYKMDSVIRATNTSILNLQFLDMHGWEDMKDLVFLHSFHIKEREG